MKSFGLEFFLDFIMSMLAWSLHLKKLKELGSVPHNGLLVTVDVVGLYSSMPNA